MLPAQCDVSRVIKGFDLALKVDARGKDIDLALKVDSLGSS